MAKRGIGRATWALRNVPVGPSRAVSGGLSRVVRNEATAFVSVLVLATVLLAWVPTAAAQEWNESESDHEAAWDAQADQVAYEGNETRDVVEDEAEETRDLVVQVQASLLEALRANFSAQNNATASQNANISALTVLVQSLLGQLQNATGNVSAVDSKAAAALEALGAMNTRLNSVEFRLDNTSGAIDRLELRVTNLSGPLATAAERFNNLDATVYAMTLNLTALRNETYADHYALNAGIQTMTRVGVANYNLTLENYNETLVVKGDQQFASRAVLDNLSAAAAAEHAAHDEAAKQALAAQEAQAKAAKRTFGFLLFFGVVGMGAVGFGAFKLVRLRREKQDQDAYLAELEMQMEAERREAKPAKGLPSGGDMPAASGARRAAADVDLAPEREEAVAGPKGRRADAGRLPPPRHKEPGLVSKLFRRGAAADPHEARVAAMAATNDLDPRDIKTCYGERPSTEQCFNEPGGKACQFLDQCGQLNNMSNVDVRALFPSVDPAKLRQHLGTKVKRDTAAAQATAARDRRAAGTRALPDFEADEDIEAVNA